MKLKLSVKITVLVKSIVILTQKAGEKEPSKMQLVNYHPFCAN